MRQSPNPLARATTRASVLILGAALLAGATLGLTSCGPNEASLTVTIAPKTVVIGSDGYATIIIKGMSNGTPLLDGDSVDVETTLGTFEEDDNVRFVEGALASGGQVSLRLYPTAKGEAKVTATWTPTGGSPIEASATVTFTHPEVATLHFSCGAQNIGAFIQEAEAMAIPCEAYAEDENRERVDSVTVRFLAEAGDFDPYEANDGRRKWTYNPRKGGRRPADVDPFPGEPAWSPDNGLTLLNPRDGLVTLVAYTEGLAFGLGEPYVDENDNNQWDEGEQFYDVDGDGLYSESQDTVLWKQIKILWTGEAFPPAGSTSIAPASRIQPPNATIQRGAFQPFTVKLLDRNLNILSALSPDDRITFYIDGNGGAPAGGVNTRALHRGFGINIDTSTYQIRNPNSPASYQMNSEYTFTVQNVRNDVPEPGQPPAPPEPYNVYGQLTRTYSIDEEGYPGAQISAEYTPSATGMLP